MDTGEAGSWNDWKWQIRNAIRLPSEFTALSPDGNVSCPSGAGLQFHDLSAVITRYGMKITPYYAHLIKKFDESDPIFRQSCPSPRELESAAGETEDPLEDSTAANRPAGTVIHRYRDRALFVPTWSCAVNCRFCFRRGRAPALEGGLLPRSEVEDGLRYIGEHEEIREVIVTGGDPLCLGDGVLLDLMERLAAMPRLRLLRIHTRMPVVNPYRMTGDLCSGLARMRLPIWLVTQFNHPVELTVEARESAGRLLHAGIPVLNQAVLLRGINDSEQILEELLLRLTEARIKPYYLHHLDRTRGTGHFRVRLRRGIALMNSLRGRIPGHAMPLYVLDIPGRPGKLPLEMARVDEIDPDLLRVEQPDGTVHLYRERPGADISRQNGEAGPGS